MGCKIDIMKRARDQYQTIKKAKEQGKTEVPELGVYDIDLAIQGLKDLIRGNPEKAARQGEPVSQDVLDKLNDNNPKVNGRKVHVTKGVVREGNVEYWDRSGNRINAALISADQVDAKAIAIENASPEFTKVSPKVPKFGEYLLDAEMDMDLMDNMHEFIDPTYDNRDKDVKQWNKDGIKNSKGSRVELQYMIGDMAFVTFPKGGKIYPFKAADLNVNGKSLHEVAYSRKQLKNEADSKVDKGELEITKEQINKRVNINALKEKLEKLDKVGVSDSHKARLDKVLNILVNPITKAIPDMEIYLDQKAKRNGGVIFVDKGQEEIRLSVGTQGKLYGTDMSMLEVFTHELGHGATHFALNYNKEVIGKQLNILKRFRSIVMDKIKPEDLLGEVVIDREAELEIAKERIRYMSMDSKTTNSLEEFLMYSLTNEPMVKFISKLSLKEESTVGKDWFERLLDVMRSVLETVMTMFGKQPMRTMKGDQLIMKVVADIAAANNKIDTKISLMNKAVEFVNDLDDKFADYVHELGEKNKEYVINSDIAEKLKDGRKVSAIDKLRVLNFALTHTDGQPILEGMLRKLGARPVGFVQTLIRHLRHADTYGNKMQDLTMASGQVDSNRQNTSSAINEVVVNSFSRKLNKHEKRALYSTMVIADAATLINKFENDFEGLLEDDSLLDDAIVRYSQKLKNVFTDDGDQNLLENQIKGLAELMRTGKGSIIQRRNANAIAMMLGNEDGRVVENIDILSSLYGLKILDPSVKEKMLALVKTEKDGVVNFGKTLTATKEYVRSKQTEEQNINMMKNYHREAYDDYVTSKVAPIEDAKDMKDRGYKLVETLPESGLGFDGSRLGLYVNTDMIRQPFNRSAIRYTGDKQTGLLLFEVALKSNNTEAMNRILAAQKEKGKDIAKAYEKAVREGLPTDGLTKTNVIPELDDKGSVIDYRAMVTMENKLKHLGLDTNPMEVIGRTWAHEVDVEESAKLNEMIWEELMLDAAENARVGHEVGVNKKYAYTKIDTKSPIFEVSDVANILPPEIKDKLRLIKTLNKVLTDGKDGPIKFHLAKGNFTKNGRDIAIADAVYEKLVGSKVWGLLNGVKKEAMKKMFRDGTFMVREDMILDAFGARDMSMADIKKLPKQIKQLIRRIENAWKEVVKIFKVDVVIRILPVIMGNIISNLMYSIQTGHSPLAIAKLQLEGVSELKLYIKNKKEIAKLYAELAKTPGKTELKNKITRLKNDIKNSPIYPLIKAGMYQHIVEDVGLEDFRSNSRFMNWVEDKTENWPELAKIGLHWAYVSEKTSLFQMITKATAYSDFTARYAQHTLMKERELSKIKRKTGREPTKEEAKAIDEELAINIRDAFVNYSQPDSRIMQYMNDMGFIMFTKYMVRIQKVIQDGVGKHPIRFALALLGQEMLDQTMGWEPDDIAEKSMYRRGLDNMFYMPGFTGIIGNIVEPQMYSYIKDSIK